MFRPACLLLLIFVTMLPAQERNCNCRPASAEEVPHGANEVIEIRGKTVKRIQGVVSYTTGEPVNAAVVELYDCKGITKDRSAYDIARERERLAACKTGTDGAFCFQGLPSGRYVLRAGTGKQEGRQEMYMTVSLDRHLWSRWLRTGKSIELTLRVGT